MRLNKRTELSSRHRAFHAKQKLSLVRRPVVLLESFCRRQRHLLRRRIPCDHRCAAILLGEISVQVISVVANTLLLQQE